MKKKHNTYMITVISYVIMVAANVLAVILPINGVTPGEVSDSFPNLFAPAGYTFSIWGLIYILLLGFTLYQLDIFKKDHSKYALLERVRPYFVISSILNAGWIFAWHYKLIPLSMLLMIGILLCLIKIVSEIRETDFSLNEYIFFKLPFSVYFGWITVATIANATVLLVSLGWNGFGISEEIWTMVMILVGTIIGTLTILKSKDVAYGLVICWAYIGILVKHISAQGFSGEYPNVIITTMVCILWLIISILFLRKHPGRR